MSEMNNERFEDLKDAYVLGALPEEERLSFDDYLTAHPERQAEIDELGAVAGLLAFYPQEQEPSPELQQGHGGGGGRGRAPPRQRPVHVRAGRRLSQHSEPRPRRRGPARHRVAIVECNVAGSGRGPTRPG